MNSIHAVNMVFSSADHGPWSAFPLDNHFSFISGYEIISHCVLVNLNLFLNSFHKSFCSCLQLFTKVREQMQDLNHNPYLGARLQGNGSDGGQPGQDLSDLGGSHTPACPTSLALGPALRHSSSILPYICCLALLQNENMLPLSTPGSQRQVLALSQK